MTGEEMERAIEFILQNQATLEEHIKEANERIDQSNKRIEQVNRNLSGQIAELNHIVQMTATSQGQLNERMMTAITSLAVSQQHTDRKLDALIDIVRERLEGKGGS